MGKRHLAGILINTRATLPLGTESGVLGGYSRLWPWALARGHTGGCPSSTLVFFRHSSASPLGVTPLPDDPYKTPQTFGPHEPRVGGKKKKLSTKQGGKQGKALINGVKGGGGGESRRTVHQRGIGVGQSQKTKHAGAITSLAGGQRIGVKKKVQNRELRQQGKAKRKGHNRGTAAIKKENQKNCKNNFLKKKTDTGTLN